MANSSFKSSPVTPMLGLSESFFQGSPFNSSSDSSFGIEWRKKNNLNQMNTNRTYSPGVAYLKSPNISPIVKKLEQMTITEEPDEGIEKTYIIEEATLNKSTSNSPHTPMNKTYVIEHVKKYQKNVGVEKNMENERKKIYKRRTMFLLPPTPTSIKAVSKLNTSDFEHRFTVNTILKEIGMTKYIKLFEMEEINISAFLTLNDDDLISIGILDPEERQEIIKAVETYQFLK